MIREKLSMKKSDISKALVIILIDVIIFSVFRLFRFTGLRNTVLILLLIAAVSIIVWEEKDRSWKRLAIIVAAELAIVGIPLLLQVPEIPENPKTVHLDSIHPDREIVRNLDLLGSGLEDSVFYFNDISSAEGEGIEKVKWQIEHNPLYLYMVLESIKADDDLITRMTPKGQDLPSIYRFAEQTDEAFKNSDHPIGFEIWLEKTDNGIMTTQDYQYLAEAGSSLVSLFHDRIDRVVCDQFWTLDADNLNSHVKPVKHNREYEGEMLVLGYYPEGTTLCGQEIAFSLKENIIGLVK